MLVRSSIVVIIKIEDDICSLSKYLSRICNRKKTKKYIYLVLKNMQTSLPVMNHSLIPARQVMPVLYII